MAKNNFKISGVLVSIFEKENKTATFATREFVLSVKDGNFEQFIKFQTVNDYCDLLDGYIEGQTVEVDFSLRGREWQDKYFTTLNAWKIVATVTGNESYSNKPEIPVSSNGDVGDPPIEDLPF